VVVEAIEPVRGSANSEMMAKVRMKMIMLSPKLVGDKGIWLAK
jgi:hypothetical protein